MKLHHAAVFTASEANLADACFDRDPCDAPVSELVWCKPVRVDYAASSINLLCI